MRETLRDIERLNHIKDAINVLLDNKDKHTFEEMSSDPIVFYGFVKYVEIIGEAVYMLTKDFRNEHSEVEWDEIERMRHVLVHGYYKIRPIQLWDTIQTDIVELKPVIEKLIEELAG